MCYEIWSGRSQAPFNPPKTPPDLRTGNDEAAWESVARLGLDNKRLEPLRRVAIGTTLELRLMGQDW